MDFGIYAGDTNKTIYIRLRDSTTGLAKTGLAYNSAGAVCSYVLPAAARAAITLATQTVTGAHSDGGFVEVDATNCKGLYRLDLPDAAIASGNFTIISIEFDGIIEEDVSIPLHHRKVDAIKVNGGSTAAANLRTAGDNYSATRGLAGTALPDAAADAAGGLPISDDGGFDIDAILERLTATRAGYLDFLNIGGNVAGQADVQGITQAQRVRFLPPPQMERPDSGSTDFRIWIYVYNEQHQAEDLDSNPTVTAENNAGTDRSSNLGTVTKPGATTGQYYVDYTVADSHAVEALVFKATCTEGAVATVYAAPTHVVDTTAVDFTAADRTKLDTLHDSRCTEVRMAELDAANLPTDIANLNDLDAAGVRSAVGLALANLDTQIGTLATAANLALVKAVTDALTAAAAAKLAASAGQIITGTVDTATNGHKPTTIEFQADDITEATADHYNGRIIIFTSGALAGQASDITDYVAAGGIGQFTVTALTEPPANDDTFIII